MKDSDGGQLRETLGNLGTVLTATLLLKVPETAKKFPVEQTIQEDFMTIVGSFRKAFLGMVQGKGEKARDGQKLERKQS